VQRWRGPRPRERQRAIEALGEPRELGVVTAPVVLGDDLFDRRRIERPAEDRAVVLAALAQTQVKGRDLRRARRRCARDLAGRRRAEVLALAACDECPKALSSPSCEWWPLRAWLARAEQQERGCLPSSGMMRCEAAAPATDRGHPAARDRRSL